MQLNYDFGGSTSKLRGKNLSTILSDPYANDFGIKNPSQRATSNNFSNKSHQYIGLKQHRRSESVASNNGKNLFLEARKMSQQSDKQSMGAMGGSKSVGLNF